VNGPDGVSEVELHAYLDGELPPDRVAAVEAYLGARPDEARRLAAYRRAGEAIVRLWPRLEIAPVRRRAAIRRRAAGRVAAALVAGLLFGAAGYATGALWAAGTSPSEHDDLVASVAEYHRVYAAETKHLVEIGADRRGELAAWLGKRLGRKLAIPDLSRDGLTFVGGRMLVVNRRPVGQLLYARRGGPPVGICIMRGDEPQPRFVKERDGLRLASWNSDGYAYVVVGEMTEEKARGIADSVVAAFRG
jgi:anti-sigma factor RsiW